mmetsp:Transcript_44534/g.127657  ORF Transcript_44534/g.127657 Transcript_44534/m.127657 type:complete len:269 (+) Transcript_44534:1164-1970(+)
MEAAVVECEPPLLPVHRRARNFVLHGRPVPVAELGPKGDHLNGREGDVQEHLALGRGERRGEAQRRVAASGHSQLEGGAVHEGGVDPGLREPDGQRIQNGHQGNDLWRAWQEWPLSRTWRNTDRRRGSTPHGGGAAQRGHVARQHGLLVHDHGGPHNQYWRRQPRRPLERLAARKIGQARGLPAPADRRRGSIVVTAIVFVAALLRRAPSGAASPDVAEARDPCGRARAAGDGDELRRGHRQPGPSGGKAPRLREGSALQTSHRDELR